MNAEVGGRKFGTAETVEPGEVDPSVVTDEAIPREVHITDRRISPLPAAGRADRQDQVGWATGDRPTRVDPYLGRAAAMVPINRHRSAGRFR